VSNFTFLACFWASISRSKTGFSIPITTSLNIWMKRRYESYAKRSFLVRAMSPFRLVSFRPRFRTVSIMPGMDTRAPERTETRSGLLGSPKAAPMAFSSFFRASSACFHIPCGYCFLLLV